jgi:hypothetical protein
MDKNQTKRQERVVAALKKCGKGAELTQPYRKNAAWYVFYQTEYVRLKLTCRDVSQLVNKNILQSPKNPLCRSFHRGYHLI